MTVSGISGYLYDFKTFYSDFPDVIPFPEDWNFDSNPGIFLFVRKEDTGIRILGYALSVRIYTREEFHRIRYIHPGKQADSVFFLSANSGNDAESLADDLPIQNLLRLYTCL